MEHKNLLEDIVPGLRLDPITPEQWNKGGKTGILGAVLSSGHWLKEGHVPAGESQKNASLDSFNCTGFGFTNRIEVLWHRFYNEFRNFSDRWVAFVAGTRPPGNSMQAVAEAVRKHGLVDETDLPFNTSIKTFDDFVTIPSEKLDELTAKGQEFKEKRHSIQHDWVDNTPESFMENIKISPLGVAVVAWYRDSEGYYYFPEGMAPTHDSTLVDYEYGVYWQFLDSYLDENGSYLKKVRWDTKFFQDYKSKRYELGAPEPSSALYKILLKIGLTIPLLSLLIRKARQVAPITQANVVSEPKVEPVVFTRRYTDLLAKGISKFESVNLALNNPGGLRSSPFQDGFIIQSTTGKKLATFKTYEKGFAALVHQITIVCKGTSPVYNARAKSLGLPNCGEMTLEQFLHEYAPRYENETERYLSFLENFTGLDRDVKMKQLI